jgi:hypothetical protein
MNSASEAEELGKYLKELEENQESTGQERLAEIKGLARPLEDFPPQYSQDFKIISKYATVELLNSLKKVKDEQTQAHVPPPQARVPSRFFVWNERQQRMSVLPYATHQLGRSSKVFVRIDAASQAYVLMETMEQAQQFHRFLNRSIRKAEILKELKRVGVVYSCAANVPARYSKMPECLSDQDLWIKKNDYIEIKPRGTATIPSVFLKWDSSQQQLSASSYTTRQLWGKSKKILVKIDANARKYVLIEDAEQARNFCKYFASLSADQKKALRQEMGQYSIFYQEGEQTPTRYATTSLEES